MSRSWYKVECVERGKPNFIMLTQGDSEFNVKMGVTATRMPHERWAVKSVTRISKKEYERLAKEC